MALYGNATVLVLIIFIDVNPVSQNIHGSAGGMTKTVSVPQPSYNDARKNITRTRKLYRYFLVRKQKMLIVKVIVAHHGMLLVDNASSDENRLRAKCPQLVRRLTRRF